MIGTGVDASRLPFQGSRRAELRHPQGKAFPRKYTAVDATSVDRSWVLLDERFALEIMLEREFLTVWQAVEHGVSSGGGHTYLGQTRRPASSR